MRNEPLRAHPEQHERRGDGEAHSHIGKLHFRAFAHDGHRVLL